jgi:ubiquinone/menaquinone biosynthesis C-methylase UbiE
MFSALQYMDVHRALAELKRVLRPGGLVLTTNMPLLSFFKAELRSAMHVRSLRSVVSAVSMVANTLWYQSFERRLRSNMSGNATARPIHPTKSCLIAAAERAGLHHRSDLSFDIESYFSLVLQKR